jgi:transposase InsO family protein
LGGDHGRIDSGDIRDLMIETVERRFGLVDRLPTPIEWLSDNGSPYTAHGTRALARELGLAPCTTPIESPQSNGMAEAFVKTFKRDYARVSPCPDAVTVLRQLDVWFEHYNTVHPQGARLPVAARVQKADGRQRDRPCGRRLASTAWQHNVHGSDRVKPASRAQRGDA